MKNNIHRETRHRIIQKRREKGITQEELGLEINKSQAWIAQIENGKRHANVENLNAIATALECNFSDLLPEQPIPMENNNE